MELGNFDCEWTKSIHLRADFVCLLDNFLKIIYKRKLS